MKKRILTEDDKTSIDTSINKLNNNFLNTDKTVKQIRADLDTTSDKTAKLSTKLETVGGEATKAKNLATQNKKDIGIVNNQLKTKLGSGDDISNCTTNGKTIKSVITDLNTKTANNSKLTNDLHTGKALKFWSGSQEEYNAINVKDSSTLYLIKE